MAIYNMNRISASNGQVCKDGACYSDLDISSFDNTVRAFHWNGTSGTTELCDGTDYNTNTGEGTLSAESDFQVCITAWEAAYDAHQEELANPEMGGTPPEIPEEEV